MGLLGSLNILLNGYNGLRILLLGMSPFIPPSIWPLFLHTILLYLILGSPSGRTKVKVDIIREHENKWPVNNQYADEFIAECEFHNVNAKKRVALLPEALRWFDEDGDLIESEANSDEEGELEEVGEQSRVGGDGADDRH